MTHTDDDGSWITGLMRENYEAVGFIPEPTVRERYLAEGRYVLQRDERGKRVWYLLHGAIRPGRDLVITQHCIDIDRRLRGYGEDAVDTLIERATQRGVRSIRLRCAEDLPSREFWRAARWVEDRVSYRENTRQRGIVLMRKDLWLPLSSTNTSGFKGVHQEKHMVLS